MFKLSLKIGLLFVAMVVVLIASGLALKDVDNILIRKSTPFIIIILTVAIIFWKNETVLSLKLFAPIKNKLIVLPTMLLLFAYSAWASDWFTTEHNSVIFVLGLAVVIYLQTFWEELIFRGIFLNHYLKNGNSIVRSLIYSSLIFAVLHLINLWSNPSIESVINQVIFSVLMGVFLGSLYLLSRNIYITGLAHAFINYPSYANKYQNDSILTTDVAQELAENTPLLESLLGTLFLLLAYSPFLMVAFGFLKKVTLDVAKTPLIPFTEYAFRPFSLKK